SIGLKLGNVKVFQIEKPINTIVIQDILKGSQVDEGTVVNIEISNGVSQEKPEPEPDPEKDRDVNIPLDTTIKGSIKIEAFVNGVKIKSEEIIPSDLGYKWTVKVKGNGIKSLKVLIDGVLYKEYSVDLDKNTVTEK
ncbi:MAG: hypothetical protein ACRCZK_04710, partial [Oscillospiraceae bacterium]